MTDKLQALAKSWRQRADDMEQEAQRSGKWYSSMTQEEQRRFNEARDTAYGLRIAAGELLETLKTAGGTG